METKITIIKKGISGWTCNHIERISQGRVMNKLTRRSDFPCGFDTVDCPGNGDFKEWMFLRYSNQCFQSERIGVFFFQFAKTSY